MTLFNHFCNNFWNSMAVFKFCFPFIDPLFYSFTTTDIWVCSISLFCCKTISDSMLTVSRFWQKTPNSNTFINFVYLFSRSIMIQIQSKRGAYIARLKHSSTDWSWLIISPMYLLCPTSFYFSRPWYFRARLFKSNEPK